MIVAISPAAVYVMVVAWFSGSAMEVSSPFVSYTNCVTLAAVLLFGAGEVTETRFPCVSYAFVVGHGQHFAEAVVGVRGRRRMRAVQRR